MRIAELESELLRTRALVVELEKWAADAEAWAHTCEQLYQESQAKLAAAQSVAVRQELAVSLARGSTDAVLASSSWRVTAPLRAASVWGRRGVRGSKVLAAGVLRPALERGLVVVRGNARLKGALSTASAAVPRSGAASNALQPPVRSTGPTREDPPRPPRLPNAQPTAGHRPLFDGLGAGHHHQCR